MEQEAEMSTERVTRGSSRLRTPLVAVAVVVVLGLLVVGVRQITVQLRGDDGDRSSTALAGIADSTDPAQDPTGDGSAPAEGAGTGELQTAAGEPAPADVTVGPVVADEEFGFTRPPDRVAVVAGAEAARAAAQLPDAPAPVDGPSADGPSGESGGPGISGPADGSAGRPLDAAPDDFTMVASVEPDGYRAEVRVGLGGGLEGGLAALTVDFGDGTEPFVLAEDRIAAIGSRGQVSVTHTYQPTLTPQPQVATVVATDGAGRAHEQILRFDTRAAYRLSYSPLTVTALEKCDRVGPGDFVLTWQNDSSQPPGKTSKFKLDKDESHLERGFPTTVAPVYYGEFPQLFLVNGNPAFFYVQLAEEDTFAASLLEFVLDAPYEFPGSRELPEFLRRGPVAQLGNHQYAVTLHPSVVDNQCEARIDFTVALTML
jgi:hypothetical protein